MNNGTLFRLPDYVKAPPPPLKLAVCGAARGSGGAGLRCGGRPGSTSTSRRAASRPSTPPVTPPPRRAGAAGIKAAVPVEARSPLRGRRPGRGAAWSRDGVCDGVCGWTRRQAREWSLAA